MSYKKWLMIVAGSLICFAALVIGLNLIVDHHGIRLSLFSFNRKIGQSVYPDGLNQHIFNPEFVLRHPGKFDSFIFGSSRIGAIDPEKIRGANYFNMSYSLGLPAQHLKITKAFLQQGIRIREVLIGLDEFCFALPAVANQRHLLRIPHPDMGGPSRIKLFGLYFFRKPDLQELSRWRDRVILRKPEERFILSKSGLNLGWVRKDQLIQSSGQPIFSYSAGNYAPERYDPQKLDEAFAPIRELIALSQSAGFELTFFITPFYAELYLNQAESLFIVKEKLAELTDYYDFSGFNSVTTNPLNYYEESHYRYGVGDKILSRIYELPDHNLPPDFGLRITKNNVHEHITRQRSDLAQYLQSRRMSE